MLDTGFELRFTQESLHTEPSPHLRLRLFCLLILEAVRPVVEIKSLYLYGTQPVMSVACLGAVLIQILHG